MITRTCEERQTKNGGALFYTVVEAEFDFVCAEDGSKHVVRTFGEAMDSADKSTNKAMSAAYKYACLQAFSIPTEGDNDADAHTPEVAARPASLPFTPEERGAALKKIQAAGTLPSLKDTWLSIPPALRKELAAEKDAHKRDIEEANAQLLKDTQP